MADIRSPWVNALAALLGAIVLGIGIYRISAGYLFAGSVIAVIGFLILGWALLDRRKFRRGTPESEVEGGHTIE